MVDDVRLLELDGHVRGVGGTGGVGEVNGGRLVVGRSAQLDRLQRAIGAGDNVLVVVVDGGIVEMQMLLVQVRVHQLMVLLMLVRVQLLLLMQLLLLLLLLKLSTVVMQVMLVKTVQIADAVFVAGG